MLDVLNSLVTQMNNFERAAGSAANAYDNLISKQSQAKSQAQSSTNKYSGKDIQYIGDKLLVMKASGDTSSKEYKELSEWYAKNKKYPQAKYKKGTKNALAGIANVDEIGEELIIHKPNQGRYTRLEAGDGVLPANLTERIFALANNPMDYLMKGISEITSGHISNIANSSAPITVTQGDLIVNGNMDKTVLQLAQQVLKNSSKELANNVRKEIMNDMHLRGVGNMKY